MAYLSGSMYSSAGTAQGKRVQYDADPKRNELYRKTEAVAIVQQHVRMGIDDRVIGRAILD